MWVLVKLFVSAKRLNFIHDFYGVKYEENNSNYPFKSFLLVLLQICCSDQDNWFVRKLKEQNWASTNMQRNEKDTKY